MKRLGLVVASLGLWVGCKEPVEPGPQLDPWLEACLRVSACEAEGGTPVGVQACLAHTLDLPWLWATTGPQRLEVAAMECKLAAEDCAELRACTPAAGPFAQACAASPGGEFCEGDTWVMCDALGSPIAAMDCAAAGLSCLHDVWAGCGAEPCEFGAAQASCDPEEPGVLIECNPAGYRTRIDCAEQYNLVKVSGKTGEEVYAIAGETCGYDAMRGSFGCVGTGASCDFFSQRCDGTTLETCAGGTLARRDCTAVVPEGQGCGFVQSGQFAGAASCGFVEGACGLADDEACEGGVISYCAWDRPDSVDCRAHGYSGCATAALGERQVAFCTH